MEQRFRSMGERPPGVDPRIQNLEAELGRIRAVLDEMLAPGRRCGAELAPSQGSSYSSAFHSDHSTFPLDKAAQNRTRAKRIREEIRRRRRRDRFWADGLFADPAWDMLLDLYAADLEGQQVSVSSLCIAAAVPATTALRWMKSMVGDGILTRIEDDSDRRRIFVTLSDESRSRMDRYFDDLED